MEAYQNVKFFSLCMLGTSHIYVITKIFKFLIAIDIEITAVIEHCIHLSSLEVHGHAFSFTNAVFLVRPLRCQGRSFNLDLGTLFV